MGKTHLAIGLAIAAAQSGRRVYYGTLADLIMSLEEAHGTGKLLHRMKTLTYPSLLVVDEIGYLPVTRTGAMHFFQLMSRRYEHASTVLTSNKSFEDWGEIFGDEVMAAALIERLLPHCHIVNIRGNSFPMRQHTDLWKQLHHNLEGHEASASSSPSKASKKKELTTRTAGHPNWDISTVKSGTSVTVVDRSPEVGCGRERSPLGKTCRLSTLRHPLRCFATPLGKRLP